MNTVKSIKQSSPTAVLTDRNTPPVRRVNVFMMDLMSIVPYYTGHLAAALERREDVRMRLAAITYHLDRGYFARENLKLRPGCMDLVSKFNVRPAALRKILKLVEYSLNLCCSLIHFSMRKPEVLHVQFLPLLTMGSPCELWFMRLVRRMGIPIVYTVHNVLPQDSGERHRLLYRRAYSVPDALICHDLAARDKLIGEFGVAPSRTTLIPHGPLFESSGETTQEHARLQLGVPTGKVLVVWLGIMRPYKGISFLLQAWQQVLVRKSNALLAVVGPGDSVIANATADEMVALGIEAGVRIEPRFVSHHERALFYTAADILVYPYSEITTSGALMTGLAHGKAVVTTRLEAFESVLHHGRDALMVQYGDVDGLAKTLRTLIDQPALRKELGNAAKKTFLAWQGWPEIAERTSALYRSVSGQ